VVLAKGGRVLAESYLLEHESRVFLFSCTATPSAGAFMTWPY